MAYDYSWNGATKECCYERCKKPIKQSDTAGRVKKFCDATCRKAQSRLDTERAATKAALEEQERRFQQYVVGVRADLHADLREILRKDGQDAFLRAVALVHKASLVVNFDAFKSV